VIREQEGENMEWTRILAYITGTVDQELLLRNEYLAAENRILKAQLKGIGSAVGPLSSRNAAPPTCIFRTASS